jgi:hypothetical protein
VTTLDLTIGLGVMRRAANLCHSAIYEPFREIAAEGARALMAEQARLVHDARACRRPDVRDATSAPHEPGFSAIPRPIPLAEPVPSARRPDRSTWMAEVLRSLRRAHARE